MHADTLRDSVTVVIPTRNRQALLAEAVATVVEQTFQDWELLIVDDASTDGTDAYLASLEDPRIRVLRQPEHGERSRARNRGTAEARAPFIMFLDDDDLLRPQALEELVAALRTHPEAVAAVGACRTELESGDSVRPYWPASPYAGCIWRELLFGWWAVSGQTLYRRAHVIAAGGYDPDMATCEDRKLWLELARRGPVVVIPRVVMEYRLHAGQSKPADLDAIRQRVWDEFIAGLPASGQRAARRVRRAATLADRALRARATLQFARAARLQLAAILAAPRLVLSPLTARPLWWGLKKCLLRVAAP